MSLFNFTDTNQTSTSTGGQQATQTGAASNANNYQFNPGQQALQGSLNGFANDIQNGDFSNFMPNPQMADYANMLFQRNEAPTLAGQYGMGSPQIGNRLNELQLGLAAQAQQQAPQTAINAFSALSNYATKPMGETGTSNQNTASNQNTSQNVATTQHQEGTDLSQLLSILGLLPYLPGGGGKGGGGSSP
jgi:hypothetical protein